MRRMARVIAGAVLTIGVAVWGITVANAAGEWFAVHTPSGGYYQECAYDGYPYADYGGIAGAVNYYYGPTNDCVNGTRIALGRSAGQLGARISEYSGTSFVANGTYTTNAAGDSFAVGYAPKWSGVNWCTTTAYVQQAGYGYSYHDSSASC